MAKERRKRNRWTGLIPTIWFRRCAWCGRWLGAKVSWRQAGAKVCVTHALCGGCQPAVRADLKRMARYVSG